MSGDTRSGDSAGVATTSGTGAHANGSNNTQIGSRFSDGVVVIAAIAFAVSLGRPWLQLDAAGQHASLTAITGAGSIGSAAFAHFLVIAPLLLGTAVAARVPGPHRLAFATATIGLAVALALGLIALLRSTSLSDGYGRLIPTSPQPQAGFYLALAVAALAAVSVAQPAGAAIRAMLSTRRGPITLGLIALSMVGYGFAIWLPWLTHHGNHQSVDVRVTDVPFGRPYMVTMALLFAAVMTAGVTRARLWRLAGVVLAGAWTIIGFLVIVDSSRVVFAKPSAAYHPASGLYLGVGAVVLAGVAAWAADNHVLALAPTRASSFSWAAGFAMFVAALILPWIAYTDIGRVGVLAGTGFEAGAVLELFLVVGPLLLVVSAIASAASHGPVHHGTTDEGTAARWFTVALAVALLAIELMMIRWPRRFDAELGREHIGTATVGTYAAILMTVLAAVAPWLGLERSGIARILVPVRQRVASLLLLGGLVAAAFAVLTPWIETRLIHSDDAEFQGDILRSPLGFVFLLAGMLVIAGAAAVIGGRGGRGVWAGTLTLAIGYAIVGGYVWLKPVVLGYDYLLVLAVGATANWRPGWVLAVVAIVLTTAAVVLARPQPEAGS